jgi:ubiquinone/menaquinone biosynthesis C-methylase UbiE
MVNRDERTSNRLHDQRAGSYGLRLDASYAQTLKLELVQQLARPGDRCLDVGVATGLIALPLARTVRTVHGLDLSAAMVQQCVRNIRESGAANVHVCQASATALPYPDAAFDLAFSFSTLLLVPESGRAYAEIARVLRPGGTAVLDITGRYNISQLYWRRYYRREGHWGLHAYSLGGIRRALAAVGLRLREVHASGATDQWKYVPGLRKISALERLFHARSSGPDLDHRLSNLLKPFAARWYLVLERT